MKLVELQNELRNRGFSFKLVDEKYKILSIYANDKTILNDIIATIDTEEMGKIDTDYRCFTSLDKDRRRRFWDIVLGYVITPVSERGNDAKIRLKIDEFLADCNLVFTQAQYQKIKNNNPDLISYFNAVEIGEKSNEN